MAGDDAPTGVCAVSPKAQERQLTKTPIQRVPIVKQTVRSSIKAVHRKQEYLAGYKAKQQSTMKDRWSPLVDQYEVWVG